MTTNRKKRPIEHLPIPFPKDYDPGPEFFYENFVKAFIPDMIEMMNVGLFIDQEAVEKLRVTIDKVLEDVSKRLEANPLIQQFRQSLLPKAQKEYEEKCTQSVRDYTYYLKDYKPGDITHRTWVINTYLKHIGRPQDIKEKWSVADTKKINIFLKDPFIDQVIAKRHFTDNRHVKEGMKALAKRKAELWNKPRYEKAEKKVDLPLFNPGSSTQIKKFMEMLDIPPKAFSPDTGEASWQRKHLEILKEESSDEELIKVLDALIDYSFGGIIKSNFLKAFDTFTIDGVLHGNIRLFGAKSFRNTSDKPNLLNAPSTGSIYAKPLKRCFISPKDYFIYTADLSALEDRVIANLSGDTNKCNIFLEGLDGHSLNACGYFTSQIEKHLHLDYSQGTTQFVKAFMSAVDKKDKIICDLRQDSKAPTFKLAYGGYPDAHKGGVITQEIFDNYHNILYSGITKYREEYVLPTAREQGYLHLGLGCRINTSDADSHIRTLNNATIQFWSILTLIAINELNHRIREEKLTDYIKVCSTIYDSIYSYVYEDPEIIKWLNDNLIELMCTQYLEDEIVHNEAEGEIGLNWADLTKIPNNASVEEITEIIKKYE